MDFEVNNCSNRLPAWFLFGLSEQLLAGICHGENSDATEGNSLVK